MSAKLIVANPEGKTRDQGQTNSCKPQSCVQLAMLRSDMSSPKNSHNRQISQELVPIPAHGENSIFGLAVGFGFADVVFGKF